MPVGCHRCGGWVAEPTSANMGEQCVEINICRACRLKASRENEAALARRTGRDVST